MELKRLYRNFASMAASRERKANLDLRAKLDPRRCCVRAEQPETKRCRKKADKSAAPYLKPFGV